MDIRPLTSDYAVSPQIEVVDIPAIKAAGFVAIICNRPDDEIPPELHAAEIAAAAKSAGLTFTDNPLLPGALSPEIINTQAAAMAGASGPVLAYCASGNRSSIIWSFTQAGTLPIEELIERTQAAGYQTTAALRPQLEAYARG